MKEVELNVEELSIESHTSHQGASSLYIQTEKGGGIRGLLSWTSGIFLEKVPIWQFLLRELRRFAPFRAMTFLFVLTDF